jgi:hypothetical protein
VSNTAGRPEFICETYFAHPSYVLSPFQLLRLTISKTLLLRILEVPG